jgi:internalin A
MYQICQSLSIILLLIVVMPLYAQDNALTPYEIALQRIEEVRENDTTYLDLANLGLTELPPEIGQLQNLQLLQLDSNSLHTLPPEIGLLQNLYELIVTDNQLITLPPEIGELSHLQFLSLTSNQLTVLPPEIGQLQQLIWLNLNDNQLTSLPPEIGQLQNLQQLTICNNQITHLPLEMSQMDSLLYMCIGKNLVYPSVAHTLVAQNGKIIVEFMREEIARQEVEKRQLIIVSSSGVGVCALLLLGIQFKRYHYRKPKLKRDNTA